MIEKIKKQLLELEQSVNTGTTTNENISKSSTYWHIDHSLLVINGIPQVLANSNPADFNPQFKWIKFIVMTFKKIPRGKAHAPKQVLPEDNITKEALLHRLQTALIALQKLDHLAPSCYFNHPVFGHLNVKQSIKFLWIHTEHHLKIIREISK